MERKRHHRSPAFNRSLVTFCSGFLAFALAKASDLLVGIIPIPISIILYIFLSATGAILFLVSLGFSIGAVREAKIAWLWISSIVIFLFSETFNWAFYLSASAQ